MTTSLSRRRFVQAAAGATAALVPALQAADNAPPGEQVRIGLIGCGGRGRQLLDVFCQYPDVRIVAVSDVVASRMDEAARLVQEKQSARSRAPRTAPAEAHAASAPQRLARYEQMLDRRDIDAVVIATTQHWHGLPFIQAAAAGKHVFVEKPLSHTVAEGRAMVRAATKYGVIAMMGTQQRNYPHYEQAHEILRSGRLGKIALVDCWNYHNTGSRVGRAADADPPPGLDWDRWLGPAPGVPFNPSRLNNSWWFDYSGGMLTNWAIHHIDIILRAMQADSPTSVACMGSKLVVDDAADTPDTVAAAWQFPEFLMTYNYRGFNNFRTVQSRPYNHGICFHGNLATMVLDRSGYEIWEDRRMDQSVQREDNPRFWGDGKPGNEVDGPWQRLFIDCVKAGQQPPVNLEESHRATVCCHLANIAYRVGRQIAWDGSTESILGDPAAGELLTCPRRAGYELPAV